MYEKRGGMGEVVVGVPEKRVSVRPEGGGDLRRSQVMEGGTMERRDDGSGFGNGGFDGSCVLSKLCRS